MKTILFNSNKYEIAESDYPESLFFSKVENLLDNNWILPDFDLLVEMYKNKDNLGGFDSESNYWSATKHRNYESEYDQRDGFIYVVYFGNGLVQTLPDEKYKCKCRFVKVIV